MMNHRRKISRRSRFLLIATMVAGMAHHSDHVLRADHSGWPFLPIVTPFTFSLLAYPILFFAMLGRSALGVRAGLVTALAVFTIGAHTLIETPQMQYASWALNRSIDPDLGPIPNLLCTQSPELGVAAVVLSATLNLLLLAAAASLLHDRIAGRRAAGDLKGRST
jgi:hypothetical protein